MTCLECAGWDYRIQRASTCTFDPTAEGVENELTLATTTVEKGDLQGLSSDNLEIGRWAAVVLAEDMPQAEEALRPLLDARAAVGWFPQNNAAATPGLIVLPRPAGSKVSVWGQRLRTLTGNEPPRYLLLVGGPDRFPFDVQLALERDHLTGRLDVGPPGQGLSWDACRQYCEKVKAFSSGQRPSPRTLLFAPRFDGPTRRSHDRLVTPLRDHLASPPPPLAFEQPHELFGAQATRANLLQQLSTGDYGFVFAASHGIEFPPSDQFSLWGALTDTAGGQNPIQADSFLDPTLPCGPGSVVFAFACFGAGVPRISHQRRLIKESDDEISGAPFVSALPRSLLAHPQGPVAFIGHIDRVTSSAFSEKGASRIDPYRHLVNWYFSGQGTLGKAMRESFREQAWQAADTLAEALQHYRDQNGDPHALELAWREWVRLHDFRDFILLGDPALTYTKVDA